MRPRAASPAPPAGRLRRLARRPELLFPLRFFAWAFLAWTLLTLTPLRGAVTGLQAATVQLVIAGSLLTGLEAERASGFVLAFAGGSFRYEIDEGCTAWAPAVLLLSAVFAYPARWRQRAQGLALGLPLVFALNVARLVSMAWLGVRWPALYEQAHGLWWQAFVILAVGLGWLAWARHVEAARRGVPERGRAASLGRAVAAFLATIAALELAGAWTGAIEAYGRLMVDAAVGWTAAFGLRGGLLFPPSLPLTTASLFYGGAAGAVALYLATPRVPLRARALGAVAIGAPGQFLLDAVFLGLHFALLRAAPKESTDLAVVQAILTMGGTSVAWWLWAQRQGAAVAAASARARPSCPACREEAEDLLSHVRSAHAGQEHRWRRAALKAYPELRGRADAPVEASANAASDEA